jgi:hypothetical protein
VSTSSWRATVSSPSSASLRSISNSSQAFVTFFSRAGRDAPCTPCVARVPRPLPEALVPRRRCETSLWEWLRRSRRSRSSQACPWAQRLYPRMRTFQSRLIPRGRSVKNPQPTAALVPETLSVSDRLGFFRFLARTPAGAFSARVEVSRQ